MAPLKLVWLLKMSMLLNRQLSSWPSDGDFLAGSQYPAFTVSYDNLYIMVARLGDAGMRLRGSGQGLTIKRPEILQTVSIRVMWQLN